MKKILSALLIALMYGTSAHGQIRNDDFFPLKVGNQWTYSYSTSEWDQLGDFMVSDSGSAACSIVSKYDAADSTLWGFMETRSIVRRSHFTFPPHRDTSYSITDTTLFGIVEHHNGNHLLVRTGLLNWRSVFPMTEQFADSATIFRYSPSMPDTFSVSAQYPKGVIKPQHILAVSFKRLIGPTRISYSDPYMVGDVRVSDHVLESAIVTAHEQRSVASAPHGFALSQNFPNPFNPVTIIPFSLTNKTKATIRIYDLLGRCITTVFDADVQPGSYHAIWNATFQSSGTYICVLRANGISKGIKLTLLK